MLKAEWDKTFIGNLKLRSAVKKIINADNGDLPTASWHQREMVVVICLIIQGTIGVTTINLCRELEGSSKDYKTTQGVLK